MVQSKNGDAKNGRHVTTVMPAEIISAARDVLKPDGGLLLQTEVVGNGKGVTILSSVRRIPTRVTFLLDAFNDASLYKVVRETLRPD